MLALMLLCAGLGSMPSDFRRSLQNKGKIFTFTALSWLLPTLAGVLTVVALGCIPGMALEVRLAVLIVSAMPVANSSAGWANQLNANLPLSLAVLIAATTLSPVITVPLINLGIYTTGLQRGGVDILPAWGNDMSMFFALWVFIPIILGMLLSQLIPRTLIPRFKPLVAHVSLAMLLLLNYVNGTVCLPRFVAEPGQFVEPLLAAGLLISAVVGLFALIKFWHPVQYRPAILSSVVLGPLSSGRLAHKPADEISLLLAVVMRNTGAAMVYTSTALVSVPMVSLVVLFYTLMQHIFVGIVVGLLTPATQMQIQEATGRDCESC